MAKPAGHAVNDGRTVTFPSDGTVVSGDPVSLDVDGVTPYDSATAAAAAGVVSDVVKDDHDAGDNIEVHVTGVVIANVAAGVARGDTVADDWVAFSDEGGQYKQSDSSDASLDAGTAAVHLG